MISVSHSPPVYKIRRCFFLSIKIMSWVWDQSPYGGKLLLLHLAMADFADDAGVCWPSQTTLARKARTTDRYVRDAVSRFITDGYVEIVKPSNGKDTHRYRLIARKSVPPRKSEAGTPEISDRETGNLTPKNRQEPSITTSSDTVSQNPKCPYCHKKYDPSKPHACSAMNMLMR